jgi:hypothetical protein
LQAHTVFSTIALGPKATIRSAPESGKRGISAV